MTRAEYRAVYLAAKAFTSALKAGDLDAADKAADKLVELIEGIPPQRMYDPENPRRPVTAAGV